MPGVGAIDALLDALARDPFRARFRLRGRERGLAQLYRGAKLRRDAGELITKKLAPAAPPKDGTQTPYRGHPVFVAQHATATCCRFCLQRSHAIRRGHELTAEEQAYVVEVVTRWIERELADVEADDTKLETLF